MRTSILFFLLLFTSAFSQSSIGFRANQDTSPLTSYRLPDWGYSILSVGFQSYGKGRKNDDEKVLKYHINNSANGRFRYFRENDARSLDLSSLASISHLVSKDGTLYDMNSYMEYGRRIAFDGQVEIAFDRYFPRRRHFGFTFFAQGGINKDLEYIYPSKASNWKWEKGAKRNRSFFVTSRTSLCYGFGRIRNVTPVIRALRFRERYANLGRTPELTQSQVQELAKLFSQYSGYNYVYDRSDKYFWDAAYRTLDIDSLAPFHVYYLRESFLENVGNRFEGWQIDVQLDLSANHYDNTIDGYERYTTRKIGVNARWYKNLNLDHQISFSFFPGYDIRDIPEYDSFTTSYFASFSHLWIIADRLTLSTSAWAQRRDYNYSYPDDLYTINSGRNYDYYNSHSTASKESKGREWQTSLSSQLTFFFEDQLSFSTYASFATRGWHLQWRVLAQIEYYIDRSLH